MQYKVIPGIITPGITLMQYMQCMIYVRHLANELILLPSYPSVTVARLSLKKGTTVLTFTFVSLETRPTVSDLSNSLSCNIYPHFSNPCALSTQNRLLETERKLVRQKYFWFFNAFQTVRYILGCQPLSDAIQSGEAN